MRRIRVLTLRLRTEDGERSALGKVVQELAV